MSRGLFGRKAASPHRPTDLHFKNYRMKAAAGAPPYDAAPLLRRWVQANMHFQMFGNDNAGDCTIAAPCRMVELHTMLRSETFTIKDSDALAAYSVIDGYDGTPATDNGGLIIDSLTYMRDTGIGGMKCGPFVRVVPTDVDEMQAAINLCGGVVIGANLPLRAQSQDLEWYVPSPQTTEDAPGSWGGHAFILTGYERGLWYSLPWTNEVEITDEWRAEYVDEAWAILDPAWVNGTRPAPNGFDFARLQADLQAIGITP